MINKILLSLYLIIGVMLVVIMLLYSLDCELEIMENQDRDYQEYIERESRWKKQYSLMQNVGSVCTLKY